MAATSLDMGVAGRRCTTELHTYIDHHAGALQAPTTLSAAHASAMAAASNEDDVRAEDREEARLQRAAGHGEPSAAAQDSEDDDDDDEDEDEDEADEEPKLKYSRLTASLGPVYRNGDATSTFVVGGDKMVRRNAPAPRPRALTRR